MIKKTCLVCGKKFEVRLNRKETAKYCSYACHGKTRRGIELSDEIKRKIGEANKGRKPWLTGKHHSEETKKKMSESKVGKKNPMFGEREELRRRGIIGIKKQQDMKEPTSIEKKVYDELKARGILFETQKLINGRFLVDAYIPSLNLVIEADGGYWHGLDRVIKKDRAENAYLKECGYNVLRLTETEINNGYFKQKIEEVS